MCPEPGVRRLPLLLRSAFRRQALEPAGKLSCLERSVRPTKSTLAALPDDRNVIPGTFRLGRADHEASPKDRRVHALTLEYSFSVAEAGEVKVSPAAGLGKFLYESPFEAPLWGVFDETGAAVNWGAAHSNKAAQVPPPPPPPSTGATQLGSCASTSSCGTHSAV